MLIQNMCLIGNRILYYRKKKGMTQGEAAEAAGLSNRAYADIERGTSNMRVITLLRICEALCVTPNDLLTPDVQSTQNGLLEKLNHCSVNDRKTAFAILNAFLENR